MHICAILSKWNNNFSINLGVILGCAEVVVPEEGVSPSSRCIPEKPFIYGPKAEKFHI